MNPFNRTSVSTLLGAALLAGTLGACGSASTPPAPAAAPRVQASTPPVSSPPPGLAGTPSLTASDVADHGLPSKVGAGKLSTPTIKRLMQFFEDKVGRAYATGNANALDHYLAGPMLSGNRATINLLTSQHRRNVFRIHVQTVKPEANQAHRVVLDMTGDMTVNYFFDPRTHKVLSNGLPGPSQVAFLVFLDQNPKTGTWYWTGEKSAAAGATGSSGTIG
jgi:hypothetical protein